MNFQNCTQKVNKMAEGGPSPADIPGPTGPSGPPDIIPDIIPVDLGENIFISTKRIYSKFDKLVPTYVLCLKA